MPQNGVSALKFATVIVGGFYALNSLLVLFSLRTEDKLNTLLQMFPRYFFIWLLMFSAFWFVLSIFGASNRRS